MTSQTVDARTRDLSESSPAPSPATQPPRTGKVPRDIALDTLRGWAIVLMVVNHVGPNTRVCTIAHFTWYVTAANWFIVLSGVVLGMVCARRLVTEGPWPTYRKLLLRARHLWIIHCVLMFAVVLFHETTGRLHQVASVSAVGGWLRVLWMVPALRLTSDEFMNILPLYVVFLGLTPIALEALRRNRGVWMLAASFALYLVAQRYPGWGRIADPISGKRIFNIEAWQFVFFAGLFLGYHRDYISAVFWPRHRRWLLPLCWSVFGTIFVFAQLQRPTFARLGLVWRAANPYFWGKLTAAPGQTVYFFAMLVISYWLVRRVIADEGSRAYKLVQPLATIGRYSLYCFLIHLVFALASSAANLSTWPDWIQETLTVAAVIVIYQMAKNRILAKVIPN
jgi:hypothetical protein